VSAEDRPDVVSTDTDRDVSTPQIVREVITIPSERQVTVSEHSVDVITTDSPQVVVERVDEIQVVSVGEPGPRGATGPAGSGVNTITRPAATALGGHRVVIINASGKAAYADKSQPTHVYAILGVTTGAAEQDADVEVQTFGEMQEPSFNWTLNQEIFLGANGQMTQTPPSSGFQRVIGFPLATDTLFIDLNTPVVLAA